MRSTGDPFTRARGRATDPAVPRGAAAWRRDLVSRRLLAGAAFLHLLALSLLSWVVAHTVVYRLLPGAAYDARLRSGGDGGGQRAIEQLHGYLEQLGLAGAASLTLACIAAVAVLGRVGAVARRDATRPAAATTRGTAGSRVPARTSAGRMHRVGIAISMLLPPAAFVAMELHERAAAGLSGPPMRLLVVGVLVQAAVGTCTHWLAVTTLRGGARVLDHVAARHVLRPALVRPARVARPVPAVPRSLASNVLARKLGLRGPPAHEPVSDR